MAALPGAGGQRAGAAAKWLPSGGGAARVDYPPNLWKILLKISASWRFAARPAWSRLGLPKKEAKPAKH